MALDKKYDGTPAAAYRGAAEKFTADAKGFAKNTVRPAMQRGFPGIAAVDAGVRSDMAGQTLPKAAGTLTRGVLAAVPALAMDVGRSVGLASGAVFDPWVSAGKQYTQGFSGGSSVAPAAPATPAPLAAPAASPRPVLDQRPPLAGLNDLPGIDSVKDWSGARVTTNLSPALPSMPQGAPTGEKLRGVHYDGGNADIYATSTRKDGKLNSFTGVGDPNRPNWENRPENRQDHLAAVARGEKAKADVVQMAVNYAAQGDREGANRMALNDPAATAAVGREFENQRLKQAAMAGNRGAAGILERMMANEGATGVAKLNAETSRYGHDQGLKGEMARAAETRYGTDVGAQVTREGHNVEQQKLAAAADADIAGKAGANRKAQSEALRQEMLNAWLSPKMPDGTDKTFEQYAADMGMYDRAVMNPQAFMYKGMLAK